MTKGDITRSRILDEAVRIASRDGLGGLTIGVLAESLSLSKSGLFAHFGSKESLQVAVLEHTSKRYRALIGPRLASAPAGLARIRALFQASLDWIDLPELPGGCPIAGACFELDDREGAPREKLVALQKASQANLTKLIKEAVECGELNPDVPIKQFLFDFKSITLAYHTTSRVLRDPHARSYASTAFEALIHRSIPVPNALAPKSVGRK